MYYSCKGVRRGRRSEICASLTLCAGVLLVAVSLVYTNVGRLLFAVAAPVLFFGVMLLLRYCFTEYTYTLDGDTFTVSERLGHRNRITVRLLLSDVDSGYTVSGKRFSRPKGDVRVYDYRPELFSREYTVLILKDPDLCEGRERALVLISPDEKMLHLLGL